MCERVLCNAWDHPRFILEDLILAQVARDGKFPMEFVIVGKPDCRGFGRKRGRGPGPSLPRYELADQ